MIRVLLIVFGLFLIIGSFSFFAYDELINAPKAAPYEAALKSEFHTIRPMPDSKMTEFQASHRPREAWVDGTFSTPRTLDVIGQFYDEELSLRGWQRRREMAVRDWGRDLGGREIIYCKGPYRADLQYAGAPAEAGWTYSLDLAWGKSCP